MIEVVTGSRTIINQEIVWAAQERFLAECKAKSYGVPTLIKHGDAKGVDSLIKAWAISNNIEHREFKAKWNDWKGLPDDKIRLKRRSDSSYYNVMAGHNRNIEMADSGFDICLAIRNLGKSNGTDQMIDYAIKLKKPVFLYKENSEFRWL